MSGIEDAVMSGAGHLLSFAGTDTIPAIDFLEQYYNADCEKELIGGSVPATEHSVSSLCILSYAESVDAVEEEWNEESQCWEIKHFIRNGETV